MSRTAFFKNISPIGKLIILLILVFLFALIFALSGLIIGMYFFDTSLADVGNFISNPVSQKAISFIKFYQVINQIGIFILPSFVFAFLVSNSTSDYLSFNKSPKLISLLIGGMIIYTILPAINFLGDYNAGISLPNFLSNIEDWMIAKEEQAQKLTIIFLNANTISGLLVNIFIVALIPAIGEELLFRGILLKLFNGIFKNIHIAVIVSAILFSAIHLQFFGFFPRALLGLLLGYLFVFTKNLWVPIFAHFLNNASSVIIYYLHNNGVIKTSMENFGATQNNVYIIGSVLITAWLMIMMYQKEGVDRFSSQTFRG